MLNLKVLYIIYAGASNVIWLCQLYISDETIFAIPYYAKYGVVSRMRWSDWGVESLGSGHEPGR